MITAYRRLTSWNDLYFRLLGYTDLQHREYLENAERELKGCCELSPLDIYAIKYFLHEGD